MRNIYLLLVACCLNFASFAQTTYYSKSSGDLNLVATWGTNLDGTGTPPANFTTNNQKFNIRNASSRTLAAGWTVSGTNSKIIVGDTTTLTELIIPSGFSVTGTIDVAAASKLTIQNATNPTLGTLNAASTVDFNGSGAQTVPAATYGDLTISGARAGSPAITLTGVTVIMGAFSPTATGNTYTTTGNTINYRNATGLQTVVSSFPYNSLTLNNTSGIDTVDGALSVSGTLTTTAGGTLDMRTYSLTATTITNAGIIATQNTSGTPIPAGRNLGGTINYNAASGGQTIIQGTYATLTLGNTSGTNTPGSDLVVNTALNTTAGGTLDMQTSAISGTLTTITNNGTISTLNTGTPFTTGKTWGGSGTVIYAKSDGGQNVMAGTYNCSLTTANSSGTNTATGSITANSTLTTAAGGTLSFNTANFQLLGATITPVNNGTIQTVATVVPIPATKNWGGTVIYNRSIGAQPISAGTYNELIMGNTSGLQTAGGIIAVNDTLTTMAGGTLDMAANQLIGSTMVPMNNGTITTSANAVPAIPTGKNWTGVVQFARNTTTQSIATGTYQVLRCINAAAKTAGGDITVADTFLTSGGAVGMDVNRLIAGTLTMTPTNSTTLTTSCNANPSLPAGKSWGGMVQFTALTGGQSIPQGTYNILTCSNTSSSNIATGDLEIGGAFTANGNAAASLDMGVNKLVNVGGVITNTGTIITQNTTDAPIPSGKSWPGTIKYNAAAGGQTIQQGTYATLTLANTSGTDTAIGSLAVNTALNVAVNDTLDMRANALGGTLTTITNNGTVTTLNTSGTPFTTGKTWGGTGTVIYAVPTGGQTLMAGTYAKLSLLNSSGIDTVNNSITVGTTLTTTAGGTLSFNTASHQLLGAMTPVHNGIIQTVATVVPIPAGKNWGGTVIYNRLIGVQPISAGTYSNLTMGNTSGLQTAGGNITVTDTLTTASGSTLVMGGNQLFGSTIVPVNNGIISTATNLVPAIPTGKSWTGVVQFDRTTTTQSIATGTYQVLRCINAGAKTAGGDITVTDTFLTSGGAVGMDVNRLIAGTLTMVPTNSTTLTTSCNANPALPVGKSWGGTVQFTALTGGQSIPQGTYNILTCSNTSGTNTATGDIGIGGAFTANGNAAASLDMAANKLVNVGGVITNTGTIITQNTTDAPIPSGKSWPGTIKYNAASGGQTIQQGTYATLTLANTSGIDTAISALAVNTALNVAVNDTLDMRANVLAGTLTTITNNGTVTTLNTSGTPFTTGKTWGGTGTVIYAVPTGGQTVMTGTYAKLSLLNSSGIDTVTNSITVGTTLTTTAGGTLSFNTASHQLLGAMTPVHNGIIQTVATVVPIPAGKNWGGTVIYNRLIGVQPISAGTYSNLTMGNTSGTNTAGGSITVNDTLITTHGGVLDFANAAYQLTGTLNYVQHNGTIQTICTTNPAIPSGKQWNGTGGIARIIYAALTGTQFVPGGTYKTLICNNTSLTNTVTGTVTVDSAITISNNAAASLDMGTNVLRGALLTINNLGSLKTQNATDTALPSGKVWPGTINYNNLSGTQTIQQGTYATLTLANTSGTDTANGPLTVNTALNTTASGIMDMRTNALGGTLTTITNNGTVTTLNTSGTPFTTGKTWGGTGTVIYAVPTGGQTVTAGTYAKLSLLNSSGIDTVNNSITVGTTLTTTAGGTLGFNTATHQLLGAMTPVHNGIIQTVATVVPIPAGKNWGGTVIYNRLVGLQPVSAGTYSNLTLANTSGTNTVGGSITVNDTLITTHGGLLDFANAAHQLLGTLNYVQHNGTIQTICTSNPPIPAGKQWNGTGGIARVIYNAAAGGQFIPTGTYKTLVCNNTTVTNTATGTITVDSALNTTGAAAASLDMGTNVLRGALLTITGAGSLKTQNTTDIALPSGKVWPGTINYNNLSGTQTIQQGTYATLTLANTSGTDTANGALTVNTALNTTASGIMDMRTNALAGTLTTITNNGTVTTLNTSGTPFTTGKTWGGTGTVIYAVPTGGQTVMAGTYAKLSLLNSSGIDTVNNSITVGTTLTTTAGGTLGFNTANHQLLGAMTPVHNGIIQTVATVVPIPAGKNWGGTVIYNRLVGLQPVSAGTYSNLTLANTSGTNTVGGSITVNDTLITTHGGLLDFANAAHQLLGTLNYVQHNGTIQTICTSNPPIPAGKQWNGTGGIARVIYNAAAGGQFIPTGTYKTLVCNNTTVTNTATGTITVDSALNTTGAAAASLDMGTNVLRGALLTITGAGSLKTQNTTDIALPAGKVWTGTVNYNNLSGTQTIQQGTYATLTLANTGGTDTANGALTVNTALNTTASGIMDMRANALAGTLTTITNNGTITTLNTSGTPFTTGKTWGGTGTVVYAVPTGGQTVMAGTYTKLSLMNSSGIDTVNNSITVGTTLTTTAGGTLSFNTANHQLLGAMTPVHNGIIQTVATVVPIPATKNWGGKVIYNAATGAQPVSTGTYNELVMANTSGVQTAGGTITVNDTLATASGGILDMAANQLIGTTMVPMNNGTITTSTNAVPALPTGKSWTGVVQFSRNTTTQSITAGTYQVLRCINAGTKTAGGDITVADTFLTSGGAVGMDVNRLIAGTLTMVPTNSTTITTSCNADPAIPAGKTWGGTVQFTALTGNQYVPAGTYTTLLCNNTSDTNRATGNITVNTAFTTSAAGGIFDMGTNMLAGAFTPTNTGTLRTGNTSSTPIPSGKVWAGTVHYTSDTGGQTLVQETSYVNLRFSNSSGTNVAGGSLLTYTATGILTTGTGTAILDMQTNQLAGALTPAGGGTIRTASSVAAPITTGKVWTQTIEYNKAAGGQPIIAGTYNGGLTNSNTFGINYASGAVTVGGNLTLTAGSVLSDTGTTIQLNGNIAGTGTHRGLGKIRMNTSGSTISGATLGNIDLNNAGGFFLTGDPTINNTLTFTTGTLNIGSNNLTMGSAAPAIAGASASNMIIASGAGQVRKLMTAIGSYTFPIGDSTLAYSPIVVNMTGGTFNSNAYAAVSVKNSKHPNNLNANNYLNRYWKVATSSILAPAYTVTATYQTADVNGTEASMSGAKYAASQWTKFSPVNAGAHTLATTSISDLSADISAVTTAAPTVSVSPSDTVICSGHTINIVATPVGDAPFTYAWSPATGLSATTGSTVMATPTTGTVVTTYIYTVTVTDANGFTNTTLAKAVVSVNPSPAVITGTQVVCQGLNTTLFNAVAGGSWSSNATGVATVGSSSGIVHGVAGGTATITYQTGTCFEVAVVTVNPSPAVITGTPEVCEGATTPLADVTPSGSWSSSNTANATIGSSSGIVNGILAGTSTITYTLPTGCLTKTDVTVDALPATIGGTTQVCEGLTTILTNITPSGTWSSSNEAIATVGSLSGSVMGVDDGTATITYMISATGCYKTTTITVNPLPAAITGTMNVCEGLTTGLADVTPLGSWSSSNTAVVTVGSASGVVNGILTGTTSITYTLPTGCIAATGVTVNPQPAAISGTTVVCEGLGTTLTNDTAGGIWSSSAPLVATIGSLSGIVTGAGIGTTTIAYTLPTGCNVTKTFTVNPLPAMITGTSTVCEGLNTPLGDITPSGVWSSSNTANATIGSSSGIVHGVLAGTTSITYTLSTGCINSTAITVNPSPATITGIATVCEGLTTTFFNGVAGGVWSSSNGSIASVGSSDGIVTGEAAGSATITYTLPEGCFEVRGVTVNPIPAMITGANNVCEGLNTPLGDITPSGIWSSSNTANATIGSSTGIVHGVLAGTTSITYALSTGCINSTTITVNPSPATIAGIATVCEGLTTTFFNGVAGGVWSSSNGSIASVGSSDGIITGEAAGSATITYTLPEGCFAVKGVTVNALPAMITGANNVCEGLNAPLGDITPSGIWSSSNTANATIGSSTGIVHGVLAGTTSITYTLSTGCINSTTITVNPSPATITGTASVCATLTTTFFNGVAGGVWGSSNGSIASVGSSSGIITGGTAGTATITYTLPEGCFAIKTVTVNPMPTAFTGSLVVCELSTTTLGNGVSGGTWSSGNTPVATVGLTTGTVTGVLQGTANITYRTAAGCTSSEVMTVDPLPVEGVITGASTVNEGATIALADTAAGGVWSSRTANATVNGSGIVTGVLAGTTVISYTVTNSCGSVAAAKVITVYSSASGITGYTSLCLGTSSLLSHPTPGGTWSSSNVVRATVGSSSGLVTGISMGTAFITYTVGGVPSTIAITVVDPLQVIGGTTYACLNTTATLSHPIPGGTWTTDDPLIATVDPGTGAVTGNSVGTTTITYSLNSGCFKTATFTVRALPSAITGTLGVCTGGTALASNATSGGGFWSTSSPTTASVGTTSGIITGGVSGGTTTITFTAGLTGCTTTAIITVNTTIAAITGTLNTCPGAVTPLNSATPGGTWSSSTTLVATVGTTGVVSGVNAGTTTITYAHPSGCSTFAVVTVNQVPAGITGSTTICLGSTTPLADATPGGVWSSVNGSGTVTIGSATGIVNGLGNGTATVSYTNVTTGCARTAVVTVSGTITSTTGTLAVCKSTTTTLSNPTPGGVWISSNTAIATVVAGSGVVTGVALGTATISYTVSSGCKTTSIVTVSNAPATITGTLSVCPGATTTLSNSGGGVWSSSNTAVGSIDPSSGVVTGLTTGTTLISYTIGSCSRTAIVTVKASPLAIAGSNQVCVSGTTTLTNPTGSGTWASSTVSKATVGLTSGVVSGVSSGTSTITFTATATGCATTTTVTVNPPLSALTGTFTACPATTTTLIPPIPGGTWTSSSAVVATVGSSTGTVTGVASGNVTITYTQGGCKTTSVVTINQLPAGTVATTLICVGNNVTFTNTTPGGIWSTTAGSGSVAIGTSGIVTGSTTGTATVSYTSPSTGCARVTAVTVNAAVPAITGTLIKCAGATSSLSNAGGSGTWGSSTIGVATVNSGGVVTAVAAGTATITFTKSAGCIATDVFTTNAIPGAFAGSLSICIDATSALSSTGGGTWSSSAPGVGTINAATGVLLGIGAGSTIITNTMANGCTRTASATVKVLPTAVTGTAAICTSGSTTFFSVGNSGTWSSGDMSVATIGASSGVIAPVMPGTATITFTVIGTGCTRTRMVTVSSSPSAGNITGGYTMIVANTLQLGTTGVSGGTWTSSDPSKATVSTNTGLVTGIMAGTTIITYSVNNGCGVAIDTNIIDVTTSRPGWNAGSTVTLSSGKDVVLFPNPTQGTFTLKAPYGGTFTLYTLEGREAGEYTVEEGATDFQMPHGLAAGIYACKYMGNNGSIVMIKLVYEP